MVMRRRHIVKRERERERERERGGGEGRPVTNALWDTLSFISKGYFIYTIPLT